METGITLNQLQAGVHHHQLRNPAGTGLHLLPLAAADQEEAQAVTQLRLVAAEVEVVVMHQQQVHPPVPGLLHQVGNQKMAKLEEEAEAVVIPFQGHRPAHVPTPTPPHQDQEVPVVVKAVAFLILHLPPNQGRDHLQEDVKLLVVVVLLLGRGVEALMV